MADVVAAFEHLVTYPDPIHGEDLADHMWPNGLSAEGFFLAYQDAQTLNKALTNNGHKLINAPLRLSLIASSSAIVNTASSTEFSKQGVLRAGAANVSGAVICVVVGGRISTKSSSPGNIGIGINIGGTSAYVVGTSAALTASATNFGWSAEARFTVRTTGASGAIRATYGAACFPSTGAALLLPATSDVTVNLTIDRDVEIFADWETADAANSITLDGLEVNVKLPGETVS